MPDAAVGKLDEQPDEEHAFGPTASLVAEWMRLRCLPIPPDLTAGHACPGRPKKGEPCSLATGGAGAGSPGVSKGSAAAAAETYIDPRAMVEVSRMNSLFCIRRWQKVDQAGLGCYSRIASKAKNGVR